MPRSGMVDLVSVDGVLRLDGRGLTELPPELWTMKHLEKLYLSGNRLSTLPADIAKLTNLQVLSLDGNDLTELPAEIGALVNLRAFSAFGNKLTSLPPEICRLRRLVSLDLTNNQLRELPEEIGRLANLRTLSLSRNELGWLPDGIGALAHLDMLSLAGNRLRWLPDSVGDLRRLQAIDVGENALARLPESIIPLIDDGLTVHFDGSPLAPGASEAAERSSRALATFLRSLADGVVQYETKVLIVGEGNVGKTSLVAALTGAPFEDNRPTTHGIEVRELLLQHPAQADDEVITIRTWDFGGQEVYRITHQFFFSARALYLVVWNPREGHEQNEVEAWLRRIRLRIGEDAVVLIVATHVDERSPEIDYPALRRSFGSMLRGSFAIDSRTGTGIDSLREAMAMQAASLPQMGQLLSARWAAARDDVLVNASSRPYMTFDEFAVICRNHRIEEQEVDHLARLLHDLGHIIHFGDDDGLRDLVVLNPEWLTKAISYLLEDPVTRSVSGVLDHRRLRTIWSTRPHGPDYPRLLHPYFLRLMEKFEICYRLPDDDSRSLVAQLVPHERPTLPWEPFVAPAPGIRVLRLVCELSEPSPPGLIAWLTVRHHDDSTETHWRGGVFLRHRVDAYASEALLELSADGREVMLEVRAPSPDLYFNVLRDSIEHLIRRRWPGLSYRLFVPCTTIDPAGHRCLSKFPLEGLLGYRERSGGAVPCLACQTDHDVTTLVTGFEVRPMTDIDGRLRLTDRISAIEAHAADSALVLRRLLKATEAEVVDCPRLFSLTEAIEQRFRLSPRRRRLRLVLWCEHPGAEHLSDAEYMFDRSSELLLRVGPYVDRVFRTLKLLLPLAGAAVGVPVPDLPSPNSRQELARMTKVIASLGPAGTTGRDNGAEPGTSITPAEGAALRAFRKLLFQLDPAMEFGGLRRVSAPSGEFLWICPAHYPLHDPGLPVLPA